MNQKVSAFVSALALVLFSLVLAFGPALLARASAPPRPGLPADAVSYLPASDAIALIDVHRLLNEMLPRILAADPAKLAHINSEIDKFKLRTGIDPRSFDRVALGMRYSYPSPNHAKVETVAIAHGVFDARALVAAGRAAAKGKYRDVQHHGATIAVFNISDQIKWLGLWNMKVNELAVCALDQNTLAIGTLPNVRAAIEAGKSGGASSELAALAGRDPNSVIGFAGNITHALLDKLNLGNEVLAKDVNSIRQVYGSVGMIETDVSLFVAARTETADAAKSLSETATGLKQLGAMFINRMTPAKRKLAQSALDNLKITTQGNELDIRTQVAAADLAALIK